MTQTAEKKTDYTTSSARWRAIVNRDAAATCFVYGVRTTKIYCRPRCPARLARRANVEFYDTPKQAEEAGYRPCKRCKPEDLRPPVDPHISLARKACETLTLAALAGRETQRPTLHDLAAEAGLTPSHFHRVFKKVVGVTPGKYARSLTEGDMSHQTGVNEGFDPSSIHWAAKPIETPVAADMSTQIEHGQIHQSPLHDPDTVPIDWNEFDMMLAATSGSRAQPDGNGIGGCFSGEDFFDSTQFTLSGQPLFSMDNGHAVAAAPFGFAGHLDDTIDFPLRARGDYDLGDKAHGSPSLPSSSQRSRSPTDSPRLFDSYTSLTASPLLDDVDCLDSGTAMFQDYEPYTDMLDFRDSTS